MRTELVKLSEKTELKVLEDTQFVLDVSSFDENKRYEVVLLFEKSGLEAEIIAVYKLSRGEKLNLTTAAVHKVPHTRCFTYVKGVLGDSAGSDYIGKIVINKKAQQTSSYLEDNVIVVGENTSNNSQPILEIEADDVKASHGATTGRIDEQQIYYLRTRGFNEEEAKNIIIEGFFDSLLNKIKDETIREKVSEKLYA